MILMLASTGQTESPMDVAVGHTLHAVLPVVLAIVPMGQGLHMVAVLDALD
jgi:preprotein translocase subunit SecA